YISSSPLPLARIVTFTKSSEYLALMAAEWLHHVHVEHDLQSPSSIPTISLSRPDISSVDPNNLIWLKNPATMQNMEYEQVVTLLQVWGSWQ
ncbi:hypothetical protein BDR03DRAFT_967450, partial [Suillus americanus]